MRDVTKNRPAPGLDDDLEAFVITSTIIAAACVAAFEVVKRWLW